MQRNGSPLWHMWLFGLITAPLGVWLWHGQGSHFGLGDVPQPVSRVVAYRTLLIALALIVFDWVHG